MANTETLTFKLAKLVVAVAWADETFHNEELNALKQVLFSLPDLTGDEWATLEVYMDSPVGPDERDVLLRDVLALMRDQADKLYVLNTLEKLLAADGDVSNAEREVFEQIKTAIAEHPTGLAGLFSRLTGGILRKRAAQSQEAQRREDDLQDFIKNKILYDLKREHPDWQDLPEDQVAKLCSAAAILGRVAMVDSGFSEAEQQRLNAILQSDWGLDEQAAGLLTEIVRNRVTEGIDFHYLTHQFFQQTTYDERRNFIKCLFLMANASEKTSYEEIEEIRRISLALKVDHKDFIDAKLVIPSEDRGGF